MADNDRFKNSEDLVRFLQNPENNPEVQKWINDWVEFSKDHPEIHSMDRAQFTEWAQKNNIQLDPGKDIFVGNEALKILPKIKPDFREVQQPPNLTSPQKAMGSVADTAKGVLYTPFLIASGRKQIIEEDGQYRKARREVSKEWRAEHKVKTFYDSQEALDFHAGVGEDTLHQRTMDRLKEKLDKKKPGKFEKKVEFYKKREAKVKKVVGDGRVIQIQNTLLDYQHGMSSMVENEVKKAKLKGKEADALRAKLSAGNRERYESLQNRLWGNFIAQNPKKVAAYKVTLDKVNESNPYFEKPSKTAKKMEENFAPDKPKKPSLVQKIKNRNQNQDTKISELRRMVLAYRNSRGSSESQGGYVGGGGGASYGDRYSGGGGGVVNGARNVMNTARNIANLADRAQKVARVAQGVGAAIAGFPAWGTILAVLATVGGVVFVIVMLTGFTGQANTDLAPTPTPTPVAGAGGTGDSATYAISLFNEIKRVCGSFNSGTGWGVVSVVDGNNASCVRNIDQRDGGPGNPGALPGSAANNAVAVNELYNSASRISCGNPVTSLQCVGFARAVAAGIGHPLNPPPFPNGDADFYNYSFPPYWLWVSKDRQPRKGDIAVFQNNVNHIGVVESVGGLGGPFGLAEAQGCGISNGHGGYILPPGTVDVGPSWYYQDSNYAGMLKFQ